MQPYGPSYRSACSNALLLNRLTRQRGHDRVDRRICFGLHLFVCRVLDRVIHEHATRVQHAQRFRLRRRCVAKLARGH